MQISIHCNSLQPVHTFNATKYRLHVCYISLNTFCNMTVCYTLHIPFTHALTDTGKKQQIGSTFQEIFFCGEYVNFKLSSSSSSLVSDYQLQNPEYDPTADGCTRLQVNQSIVSKIRFKQGGHNDRLLCVPTPTYTNQMYGGNATESAAVGKLEGILNSIYFVSQ